MVLLSNYKLYSACFVVLLSNYNLYYAFLVVLPSNYNLYLTFFTKAHLISCVGGVITRHRNHIRFKPLSASVRSYGPLDHTGV